MTKGSNLLLKTSRQLFDDVDERRKFVDAIVAPKPIHPTILWTQARPSISPFDLVDRLTWQPDYIDRLAFNQTPTQHELHLSGAFYCLDFSLVFALMPLLALKSQPDTVLDVCAAVGGKSLFAWRALQPQRMICNEGLGKRSSALIANLQRCRVSPITVLRVDSSILAAVIPQTANVVLVDAPSTEQSQLARGGKSPGCFHPVNTAKNANRQKRILSNAAQLVAPRGHLLYTTKTYTPEENERVVEWLLDRFPQFQPVPVPNLAKYQSNLTRIPCYRLFPQSRLGAGTFTVLLQNTIEGMSRTIPPAFFNHPSVTLL